MDYMTTAQFANGKNIQIAVCDDEKKMIADLTELIKETIDGCDVWAYESGKKLLESIQKKTYDMLLLDIDMPEITGLDIAKYVSNMNPKPLVVFVTSHDELVYESLQFHPFGFVRKSYLAKELPKVLNDGVSEIVNNEKRFYFRTASEDISIMINDILFFESDGNYIKVFAKDNEYRFRDTMQSIENSMESYGFIRIHKGFIVNQSAVMSLNSEECKLINGESLPIGRSFGENARKKLMRYMIR